MLPPVSRLTQDQAITSCASLLALLTCLTRISISTRYFAFVLYEYDLLYSADLLARTRSHPLYLY